MDTKTLKSQKKFISKLLVFNPAKFAYFVLDQLLLLTTLVLFFVELKKDQKWMTYTILAGTGYLVFKFVITNWFKINTYYKYVKVFNHSLKVDNNKIKFQRFIDYTPIRYIVWTVASNLATTVLVQYETNFLMDQSNLLKATVTVGMNMLLIPSFINAFNSINQNNVSVSSNYINLVKDQYYSNESLFDNVSFADRQLNLTCENIDLTSKNGIFILLSKDDLTGKESKDVAQVNKDILQRYKEIWAHYYELLQAKANNKKTRIQGNMMLNYERIYDHVFLDFFNL
ncbi:hypothetical protein SCHIN_v1c07050 [Spiroplasma chinense]|uniref:Uncharacterized protein n=1 Tax=Spiroplasma chinense TaxID=216932 RepID=A0A5B9Y727_9MOLU|nr:hypothetical protein [Spiroplasma chinense]QEH61902.1 hypothetical protein SCHIN_v1c07050 [Spiroplasma chinense]